MSEVGCYSMNLYCDYKNESHGHHPCERHNEAAEYTGRDRSACKRQARKDGWVFKQDVTVHCPLCAKMRITEIDPNAC
jgi:hypothetical protein